MHASYEAARRPDPPTTPPGPPRRRSVESNGRSLLGLIVDDERSAAAAFTRMLSGVVHEIITAETAATALDLAVTRQPHLLLMDVRLKHSDGLDLLAEIRSRGVLARALVVSGFVDDQVEERAWSLGALAVLRKPVSLDALLAAVDAALRSRGPLGDGWAEGLDGTYPERWVSIVLHALESPQDPYLRQDLTRRGGVSLTTLKRICERVRIEPHDTRDLARMLCLLVWSRRLAVPFEALSHASEPTLERLAGRSGVNGRLDAASVREFLDRQQFVAQSNFAFRLLRRALLGDAVTALVGCVSWVPMLAVNF